MTTPTPRSSHANKDMGMREVKARKIEWLLGLEGLGIRSGRLLEVGTGSGGIAHYFAHHPSLQFEVSAVDVCDNRQLIDGYTFTQVQGCLLPFDDASFDVVISNHVIEHVGSHADQLLHLRELRRVMKPDGVGYLAVPNRWMLVEPHYGLILLSWLPRMLRTPYLRLMRRGRTYDCEPLTLGRAERLIRAAGFVGQNMGLEAMRLALKTEGSKGIGAAIATRLPNWPFHVLRRLMPTLVYRLNTSVELDAASSLRLRDAS